LRGPRQFVDELNVSFYNTQQLHCNLNVVANFTLQLTSDYGVRSDEGANVPTGASFFANVENEQNMHQIASFSYNISFDG